MPSFLRLSNGVSGASSFHKALPAHSRFSTLVRFRLKWPICCSMTHSHSCPVKGPCLLPGAHFSQMSSLGWQWGWKGPKSLCTFCGLEIGSRCQVQALDWKRPDSSLNPKQPLLGIYPGVSGTVLIHHKEAKGLKVILVSTSAFLGGPSALVCYCFQL